MGALALLLPALLSACAGAPGGVTPPVGGLGVLPANQSLSVQAPSTAAPAPATAIWPGEDWWASYGDAQLPRLIDEALAHSPDISAAAARLHKARALLVTEGLNAQDAARRVGYASASQFSREYRRMFGCSPASDRAAVPA